MIRRVKWEQITYFNIYVLDPLTSFPRCCLARETAKENLSENKNYGNVENILPEMFRILILLQSAEVNSWVELFWNAILINSK